MSDNGACFVRQRTPFQTHMYKLSSKLSTLSNLSQLARTSMPPSLSLSLTDLFVAKLSIGAPSNKRKASSSSGASSASSARAGHFGLSNDSSVSVALVTLSRLVQARDDDILQLASQTPIGTSVLALLRAAVLRVATSVGGADASFNEVTAISLWNLSASVVASQRLYDCGLSLPTKLPWPRARAHVRLSPRCSKASMRRARPHSVRVSVH
ncbi:hypothetical protein OAO87_03655 [bacterium]|nr:hypothetical protein [bacterium]